MESQGMILTGGKGKSNFAAREKLHRVPVERKAEWFKIWQQKYANRNYDPNFPQNPAQAGLFLERWTSATRFSPQLRALEKRKEAYTDLEIELLITHWMRAQVAWRVDLNPQLRGQPYMFFCKDDSKLKFVPGGRYLLLIDTWSGINAVRLPFAGGSSPGEVDTVPLEVTPLMDPPAGEDAPSAMFFSELEMLPVREGVSFNIALGAHWLQGAEACFQVWNISAPRQGARLQARLLSTFGAPHGINLSNLHSVGLQGSSVVLNIFKHGDPYAGVHVVSWKTIAALPQPGNGRLITKYPRRYFAGLFDHTYLLPEDRLLLIHSSTYFRIQLLDISGRQDIYWPRHTSYSLKFLDDEGYINGQHTFKDLILDRYEIPDSDLWACHVSHPFFCRGAIRLVFQIDYSRGYRHIHGLRVENQKLKMEWLGPKVLEEVDYGDKIHAIGFNTTVVFDTENYGLSFISHPWQDDDRASYAKPERSTISEVPYLPLPKIPIDEIEIRDTRDIAIDEGFGRVAYITNKAVDTLDDPHMVVSVIDIEEIDSI